MLSSLFLSWFLLTTTPAGILSGPEKPENIILVIGDGMGLAHIALTEYLVRPPSPLARMEVVGLQKTHSNNSLETDSGAAGTAMSCGIKTNNAMIGMASDSTPVKSIMELAREHGLKTGFVVTSSVVHATPAAFYAHVLSRGSYERIAEQLVTSGIDVFVGGGERYFYNRNTDNKNLLKQLVYANYEVIRHVDPPGKFKVQRVSEEKKIACFTAFEDPAGANHGRQYLADMVLNAKEALEKRADNGYFLMVEASQIDWAAHANDADWLAREMQDLYDMLQALLENISPDDNTLLIVTSDHETGYISLKGKRSLRVEFNSKVHSSQMVPVFATGPGAEAFAGIYDNTEIFEKLKYLLDLNEAP